MDAIVLDYHLGLLDGGVVAAAIKKVKPQVPIVMQAEDMELAYDALKSVDALVAKSDGPHFLLATVHFVLNVKPVQHQEGQPRSADEIDAPFSPRMRQSIRNGTVQF